MLSFQGPTGRPTQSVALASSFLNRARRKHVNLVIYGDTRAFELDVDQRRCGWIALWRYVYSFLKRP